MVDPVKRVKIQSYDRLKTLTLIEGFDLIRASLKRAQNPANKLTTRSAMIDGVKVNTRATPRLKSLLKNGVRCAHPECSYEGTFFAIERESEAKHTTRTYHLNLWGFTEDGQEVLFTQDHILARALGGSTAVENTQTMCCWHNWEKGRREALLCQQRRLQEAVDAKARIAAYQIPPAQWWHSFSTSELAVIFGMLSFAFLQLVRPGIESYGWVTLMFAGAFLSLLAQRSR